MTYTDNPTRTGYLLDTAQEVEKQRLQAQTDLWDPFTFARLEETGLGEGWRCLEVGGGTGSVAAWIHRQVGATGQLVVTDVETRWLDPLAAPNLEVRCHDVVADPIEESSYDLIHVRLVLMHLPQRAEILAKLITALRPGGWLVVDDIDFHTLTVSHPVNPTWSKVVKAVAITFESAGADVNYGRKLPTALQAAGLDDVDSQGAVMTRRAPGVGPCFAPAIDRLRDHIVSAGLATTAELDQIVAELHDDESSLWLYPPLMVSARGRKPNRE